MLLSEVKFEKGKSIPAAALNAIVEAVRKALGSDMQLRDNSATIFGWLTEALGDGFYEWQEVTFRTDTQVFEALQGGFDSTDIPDTTAEGRAFSLTLDDGLGLSSDVFLLLPFQFKDGTNVWAIISGAGGGGVPKPTLQGQVLQATTDNQYGWQFPELHSAS